MQKMQKQVSIHRDMATMVFFCCVSVMRDMSHPIVMTLTTENLVNVCCLFDIFC